MIFKHPSFLNTLDTHTQKEEKKIIKESEKGDGERKSRQSIEGVYHMIYTKIISQMCYVIKLGNKKGFISFLLFLPNLQHQTTTITILFNPLHQSSPIFLCFFDATTMLCSIVTMPSSASHRLFCQTIGFDLMRTKRTILAVGLKRA